MSRKIKKVLHVYFWDNELILKNDKDPNVFMSINRRNAKIEFKNWNEIDEANLKTFKSYFGIFEFIELCSFRFAVLISEVK